MNKIEAVNELKNRGYDAELIGNVVMVTDDKLNISKVRKEIREFGYNGSYGVRVKGNIKSEEEIRQNNN
jgi:hypothetical protein